MSTPPTSILFVCLGNICRSPLAEGIMAHLVTERGLAGQIRVDSAGTGDWHAGEPPHRGSIQVAKAHGIDISGQVARQVTEADLDRFDWLVAMDTTNRNALRHLDSGRRKWDRIVLLLDYAGDGTPRDVPDPYYEGGFDRVFDLVSRGCEGFLAHVLAAR